MKFSLPLCGRQQRHKLYPRENFAFQELLPLKLKPTVSGKGEKSSDVACLQEMSILFACLKKNEFNQGPCANEIKDFGKCYKDFSQNKMSQKERDKKGELDPGAKRLTHKQINQLMKKFPT